MKTQQEKVMKYLRQHGHITLQQAVRMYIVSLSQCVQKIRRSKMLRDGEWIVNLNKRGRPADYYLVKI